MSKLWRAPVLACLLLAGTLHLVAGCGDDDVRYSIDTGKKKTDGGGTGGTDAPAAEVEDDVPAPPAETDVHGGEETDSGEVEMVFAQDFVDLDEDFVLRGVWGTDPGSLVAVGNKATIIEYHGTAWEVAHQNTELDTLNGVWGSSMDDVWAVGAFGAILHRSKNGWNVGTGCTNDAACDDGDACTVGICGPDGQCVYQSSGQPGCCGGQGYHTGWESGTLEGWTVEDTSAGGAGMVWNVAAAKGPDGTPRATSGIYSLYFGNVEQGNFEAGQAVGATATSQPLNLPKAAAITLSFMVFIDTESGSSFDRLELRALVDGEPQTVWTKEDAGGTTGQVFVPAKADLTELQGKTVQIQLWFDSVDSIANNGEGVFVDDISLDSECGGEAKAAQFPTLWGVWGTGATDAYAVGSEGTILHWDGESWKRQAGGVARDMYAVGCNDEYVAAVGAGGEATTSFGGGLSQDQTATNANLRSVALLAGKAAYAVGDGGTIVEHGDGGWTALDGPVASDLHALWTNGDATFAAGDSRTILRSEGGGPWVVEQTGGTGVLYGLWGHEGTEDVWAVGEKGLLMHRVDGSWEVIGNLGGSAELRDFIAFGFDGPYVAVGGGGAIFENNEKTSGQWQKSDVPTTFVLHGVWGASADDVWVVGNLGMMLRNTGSGWKKVDGPTDLTLYDICGRSASEAYAAGQSGVFLRWDGTEWAVLRSNTTAQLRAVWGLAPDDVYAVGYGATIMHFDGLYWRQVKVEDEVKGGEPFPVQDNLYDIWGSAAEDIYAIGMDGTIIHTEKDEETGKVTWVKIPQDPEIPENVVTLRGMWGSGEESMWMVGREGTALAFDGHKKVPKDTGSIAYLYDVIGFGPTEVVAVGDLGTVLRLVPKQP